MKNSELISKKPTNSRKVTGLFSKKSEENDFFNSQGNFFKPNGSQGKSKDVIPKNLQNNLEKGLGEDFSQVDIVKDSVETSRFQALAFTRGETIHFAPNRFNPESEEGKNLIGHEFTHVKQQREGMVNPTKNIFGSPINDQNHLESQAGDLGKNAVRGIKSPHTLPNNRKRSSPQSQNNVTQFALPAVVAAMGAAEWIAAGALGYQVANDATSAASGDVSYTFDEVEGVLLPSGGSDVAAHKTAHPSAQIYEATHRFAVWGGTSDSRKMGIKFGITFLYDDAGAIGNISLSILDVYDWPGWGGSVNVNITPRSLASGSASFRFTINVNETNSWFVSEKPGSIQLRLRGGDGDLSITSHDYFGFTEIG
ncbi:DUF4157 domain-containing protein [Aquiflexum gelatinilyticum]|uniref:eCIS core domain-containing protein n=1 Tax=Aquiflexum gelatinilyticum TaxID=2961943 RepID=UPI002168D402|nr:DUF4157 domain-containing protein [Aquiflexum gelatinilyticum]MCS4435569.1 DUF4157 domain-containing protein [Aquiflexum gelatinilyticum]